MIVCTFDGKAGFPSSADKIKVTYENPFVKDSGSYTYDINFPMAIPGNRRLFGNIQRFDVKKRCQTSRNAGCLWGTGSSSAARGRLRPSPMIW